MQSFCSVQNLLSLPEFIRTFHTRPSGGFPIFLYGVPSQARKSAITSHTHDLIQPIYSLQGVGKLGKDCIASFHYIRLLVKDGLVGTTTGQLVCVVPGYIITKGLLGWLILQVRRVLKATWKNINSVSPSLLWLVCLPEIPLVLLAQLYPCLGAVPDCFGGKYCVTTCVVSSHTLLIILVEVWACLSGEVERQIGDTMTHRGALLRKCWGHIRLFEFFWWFKQPYHTHFAS